jgi:hypothetical protein
VEVKFSANPVVTKSMRLTLQDLKPRRMVIVTPVNTNYALDESIQVIGVEQLDSIVNMLNPDYGLGLKVYSK